MQRNPRGHNICVHIICIILYRYTFSNNCLKPTVNESQYCPFVCSKELSDQLLYSSLRIGCSNCGGFANRMRHALVSKKAAKGKTFSRAFCITTGAHLLSCTVK